MNNDLQTNLKIINQNFEFLKNTYYVKKIGIFGSFAKNKQTKKSDIDIIVEFSEPIGFFKFIELENFLNKLLKRKIDLATKNALKPVIKKLILQETVYA